MSSLPVVASGVLERRPGVRDFLTHRKLLILLSQTWLIILTYAMSFWLRFDFAPESAEKRLLLHTLWAVLAVKLVVFYCFGLVRGWWRYVGMSDLADITKAATLSSVILYPMVEFTHRSSGYPRSVLGIDWALTILVMGGARFAVRAYTEHAQSSALREGALIVGAGQAGSAIVRELKLNPALHYRPIGFVDDDPTKLGIRIHGIKVLGSSADLPYLINTLDAACVLIAIPSATGAQVGQIVRKCREC